MPAVVLAPTTGTVVAVRGGEVPGSVCLVGGGPLGLPVQGAYPDADAAVARPDRMVAETCGAETRTLDGYRAAQGVALHLDFVGVEAKYQRVYDRSWLFRHDSGSPRNLYRFFTTADVDNFDYPRGAGAHGGPPQEGTVARRHPPACRAEDIAHFLGCGALDLAGLPRVARTYLDRCYPGLGLGPWNRAATTRLLRG